MPSKKKHRESAFNLDPLEKLLVWAETIEGTVRLLTLIKEGMDRSRRTASEYIRHLEEQASGTNREGSAPLEKAWMKAYDQEAHIIGMLDYFIRLMKRRELSQGDVDLKGLLEEVASEFESNPSNGSTRIVVCDNGEPLSVRMDRVYLKHVLMNLVDNALYFAGDDGVVTLKAFINGEGEAGIEVVDDGPGVSESVRPFIFQPFYSTKPLGAVGCGLGLPIAQILLNRLGGRIDLDGAFREGARFIVRIPS